MGLARFYSTFRVLKKTHVLLPKSLSHRINNCKPLAGLAEKYFFKDDMEFLSQKSTEDRQN